jgi:predicted DNA-binding transcriptional regulator YafY
LARIRGAVPGGLIGGIDDSRIFAPRFARGSAPRHFEIVHRGIVESRRLAIGYKTEDGELTTRTIRPLGLYFWGKLWTVAAWCELREDFRSFRLDRISDPALREEFVEERGKTLEVFLERMRSEAAR